MSVGPGVYDDLCTKVREEAEAHTAIVIVMGGKYGPGFSLQSAMPDRLPLAAILEHIAKQIRESMGGK
jgi:hypothetical protein